MHLIQARGQRLGLGDVEVMFEAKYFWTHYDVHSSSSSSSNTSDEESACALNL